MKDLEKMWEMIKVRDFEVKPPAFRGLYDYYTWKNNRLVLLPEQDMEKEERLGVINHIRPYYDAEFFERGTVKKCLYVTKQFNEKLRQYISEKYCGGKLRIGTDYLHRHLAKTEFLIFPRYIPQDANTVPVIRIPPNAVVGKGIYGIADPSVSDYGFLSSRMYAVWMKNFGELDVFAPDYFPRPQVQEKEEVMGRLVQQIRLGNATPEDVERLNQYIDSLYAESGQKELGKSYDFNTEDDRLTFLVDLCEKRIAMWNLKEYNLKNILPHPNVSDSLVNIMVGLLNSEQPVSPKELNYCLTMYPDSWNDDTYHCLSAIMKQNLAERVPSSETVVDRNGRVMNTKYVPKLDYVQFFTDWIKFYKPSEQDCWSEVWELAKQSGTEEKNPRFPTRKEYYILKRFWNADRPLTKDEAGKGKNVGQAIKDLSEKGYLAEAEKKDKAMTYTPIMSEVNFAIIAIREIFTKITAAKKDAVIAAIEAEF